MPQITVDYSQPVDPTFDRQGFARELHELVVRTVDTKLDACRTRSRRIEDTVLGAGSAEDAVVHIAIALLPGRSPELKAELSEAVLDLLAGRLEAAGGPMPILSAEVRDLETSYRRR
ncbi:5-carboxymethyl-2-hydroxymuconate Delta-isomerase [Streptomyces sp. NPDC054802]